MPRPRLIRQRPLAERISDMLNPSDFLMWLSEEIKTRELDSKPVGTKLALFANITFLLARANSGESTGGDDVFAEPSSGWATLLAKQWVWLLAIGSALNALSLVYQTRHYRLFEANVEQAPATPSAQRVRVQSSPMSSSPLRLLTDILGSETAESRAHPDKTRDVWEVAVWDPIPACLQGIALFSPVHVLLYMFELPLDPLDTRPSVRVFKLLALQVVLSLMLWLLQSNNDQRQKDSALIQKEVFREYDTKYVHPRLHPVVRDIGTQFSEDDEPGTAHEFVEAGAPTTLIRRSFQTHPNPNYMKHIDPDNVSSPPAQTRNVMSPQLFTPLARSRHSDSFASREQSVRSSRPRQSMPAMGIPLASSSGISTGAGPQPSSPGTTSFGGNLGVYTHANSPLKKATSMNDMNDAAGFASPRNSREMAALEQREAMERLQRRASPLKQVERSGSGSEDANGPPLANPFAKPRPNRYTYERFPSRW